MLAAEALSDLRPACPPGDAVHRDGRAGRDSRKDQDKIRAYVEQYMPFHARFDGLPHRAVDKALWAFGKFISENNFPPDPIL